MEIIISEKGIILTQRKNVLDLLTDLVLSVAKLVGTPLEQNQKLTTLEYDQHQRKKVKHAKCCLDHLISDPERDILAYYSIFFLNKSTID